MDTASEPMQKVQVKGRPEYALGRARASVDRRIIGRYAFDEGFVYDCWPHAKEMRGVFPPWSRGCAGRMNEEGSSKRGVSVFQEIIRCLSCVLE